MVLKTLDISRKAFRTTRYTLVFGSGPSLSPPAPCYREASGDRCAIAAQPLDISALNSSPPQVTMPQGVVARFLGFANLGDLQTDKTHGIRDLSSLRNIEVAETRNFYSSSTSFSDQVVLLAVPVGRIVPALLFHVADDKL